MNPASTNPFSRLLSLNDEDEVLHNLAKILKHSVKCKWVALYLFDREKKAFAPAKSTGMPDKLKELFNSIPLVTSRLPLVANILNKRHIVQITSTSESELLSPLLRKALKNQVVLAAPIQVRQTVLGAAIISRDRRYNEFCKEELQIVNDTLSQAALVTSHIRLFDESLDMAVELAKRVDIILMLDEINKSISSSLKSEKILSTALERMNVITPAELIILLERKNRTYTVLASRDDIREVPEFLKSGNKVLISGAPAAASRSGTIRICRNLADQTKTSTFETLIASAGFRSLIAIPFSAGESEKGLMILADRKVDFFRNEECFALEKIASHIAVALYNARLYDEMKQLFFNTIASLANAIDAKSQWTKGHSERVMNIAETIGKELGLNDDAVEQLRIAGLLHDIGKIGIIESLLDKPIELDEDEFPPFRLHPEKGVAILKPIEQMKDILPAVMYHHEWFDGTGYPTGLVGKSIPLYARILAVADSYDAMVADRPYRKGLSMEEALAELERCSGSQFDPEIVKAFRDRVLEEPKSRMVSEKINTAF